MHQFRKHRQAVATLRRMFEHPDNVLVIHYSCESFYNRPEGRSPRVTSIAVRNLATALTSSFSIHQVAERKAVPPKEIDLKYDELELAMLSEFYEFVGKHPNYLWLHWNMRDISFGFPALAHRCRVLGGSPIEIPDERLVDLSRVLISKYGVPYAKHPRLANLIKENDITQLNMLTGEEEAAAFDKKEYVKLHLSTLRKVDNIANIVERAAADQLKTRSTWRDRHGITARELVVAAQTHWFVATVIVVVGLVSAMFTIFGVSLKDCRHPAQPAPARASGSSTQQPSVHGQAASPEH